MSSSSSETEGSSSNQPIIIPDDPQSSIGREVEEIVQQIAAGNARRNHSIIEILPGDDSSTEDGADDWAEVEADYDQEIQNIESIDLTQDEDDDELSLVVDSPSGAKRKRVGAVDARCEHYDKGARNPCLCGAYDEVNEYVFDDSDGIQRKLKVSQIHGVSEEVLVGRFLVDFVEVTAIWVHRTNSTVLVRGLAYTRTRNLDGRIQAYQNEVCQVMQLDTNDPRPEETQAAVEMPLAQLHPQPRILHKTNKPFPECRFSLADFRDKEDRESRAPLICRWQHTMYYPDKRYRRAQRPVDGEVLRHFVEEDIRKKRHRGSDIQRLNTWRGCQKIRGGSYIPNKDDIPRATEGVTQGDFYIRVPGQKYTVADMFSGAGGVTKGAKKAGFQVLLAVDHWPRCNATYRANHPEVDLREVDIMDFCNDLTDEDDDEAQDTQKTPLDLIHLSPPCQTWSPAHTVMGRNDPANIAALSACQHIVHKHRPRILSFEQTFGIIQERHLPYFNALVQSLTRYGYSLQWRVFPLVQFGLPQNRKRLLMIGSAPGEPLPAWPTPTHCGEDDPIDLTQRQRLYVSAIKACQMLREDDDDNGEENPLHNVAGAKELRPYREPWDGNKPMNRTITTSGGQSYHWDGERELTLAEFARLQGFPYDYTFVGPCIKKQIGNAFPPCVVRVLMAHLRKHLEWLDRISDKVDSICLVDDDDDDDDNSDGRRSLTLFDEERQTKPQPWWETAKKEEENQDAAAMLGTEMVPYWDCPPKFGYLNAGLNADEAWMGAIEESKRDNRRRSTAGSSVVVTGTKRHIIEVMDDDDEDDDMFMPDLAPLNTTPKKPGDYVGGSLFFQQQPQPQPQQQRPPVPPPVPSQLRLPPRLTRQKPIDPSVLPLRSSSLDNVPFHSPTQAPRSHHGNNFIDDKGYAEVFPGSRRHAPRPSVAGPSSSSSSSRAPANSQQLDPANLAQINEAFQRNRGQRQYYAPDAASFQGNMTEDEALDAALRASVQQLQQQRAGSVVACRVPESGCSRPGENERHEIEEVEEGPIPEAARLAAAEFFGPWIPPPAAPGSDDDNDNVEPPSCMGKGKGKGKAVLKAVEAEAEEAGGEKTVEAVAVVPRAAFDEDGDVDMEMDEDEDAMLQRAIAMSMEGVAEAGEGGEEGGEEGGQEVGEGNTAVGEGSGEVGEGKRKPETKRLYEGGDEEGSPSKKGRSSL